VLGVDIDEKVIIRAQSADLSRQEPKLQNLLIRAIHSGNFKISKQAASAAIYIIAVPTPLGPGHQPDLSAIYAVVEAIRPWLQADNLVLIESTCPIGTTDIITKKLRYTCPRVQIAYCPERVLPGNILHELIHNDRVASAQARLGWVE
jgi:UDP-N-acetyl-D-mannosaminuronic acid dehydrogenase